MDRFGIDGDRFGLPPASNKPLGRLLLFVETFPVHLPVARIDRGSGRLQFISQMLAKVLHGQLSRLSVRAFAQLMRSGKCHAWVIKDIKSNGDGGQGTHDGGTQHDGSREGTAGRE